jgi:hypothetical protein
VIVALVLHQPLTADAYVVEVSDAGCTSPRAQEQRGCRGGKAEHRGEHNDAGHVRVLRMTDPTRVGDVRVSRTRSRFKVNSSDELTN